MAGTDECGGAAAGEEMGDLVSTVRVRIGDTDHPLTLERGYNPATRKNDGKPLRFLAILSRNDNGSYAFAEINKCHVHGCPATRYGKKFGPCNCGAEDLWQELLREATS